MLTVWGQGKNGVKKKRWTAEVGLCLTHWKTDGEAEGINLSRWNQRHEEGEFQNYLYCFGFPTILWAPSASKRSIRTDFHQDHGCCGGHDLSWDPGLERLSLGTYYTET